MDIKKKTDKSICKRRKKKYFNFQNFASIKDAVCSGDGQALKAKMNGGFEYWGTRKLKKHQQSVTQPADSVIRTSCTQCYY